MSGECEGCGAVGGECFCDVMVLPGPMVPYVSIPAAEHDDLQAVAAAARALVDDQREMTRWHAGQNYRMVPEERYQALVRAVRGAGGGEAGTHA